MFGGVAFKVTVTIGDLLAGPSYDIEVATPESGQESKGDGTATIDDRGESAVIRATGTTADGVGIDATVNCSTVVRMGE